jgi:hypothetical protein
MIQNEYKETRIIQSLCKQILCFRRLTQYYIFKGIYGANQGKIFLNRNPALLKQPCGLTDMRTINE